jgi:hypothetical protein
LIATEQRAKLCPPKLVKEDKMQRKWLVAALTAASVAALASPAAAWGTRSHAQAYGAYGAAGPGLGFGVTVGGPYAANWGWGWNGYNTAYAAAPGGCTCGTAAYGWGYPNYGWSGYAYQPSWNSGYAYEPGVSVGWGDYGWYGGRREFREGVRGQEFREYGTRGREFTRGRERGTIRTGANFTGERAGTVGVGTNVRGENFGAEQSNFNAGANANVRAANANVGANAGATVGRGGGRRHR